MKPYLLRRRAGKLASPTRQEMIDFQLSLLREGKSYEQIQEETYSLLAERTELGARGFSPRNSDALFLQVYRISQRTFYKNEVEARRLTEESERARDLTPSANTKPKGVQKPLPPGKRHFGRLAELV